MAIYAGGSWYILRETITPKRMVCTSLPYQLGFPDAEELTLTSRTDGLKLRGWLVPSSGNRAIILLHGIHAYAWGGHELEITSAYTSAGFHVLLLDLRAHGQSDGEYVGLGLLERGDIRAVVDELLGRGFAAGKIGIHGTSYGAAVALLATAEIEEIGAIVADSAFADVRDVIAMEIQRESGLPEYVGEFLLPGIDLLGRQLYSIDLTQSVPEHIIGRISPRSVLLIHGTEDSMIPFEHAERLKAAGYEQVELWSLNGRDHAEGTRLNPGYPNLSPLREQFLTKITEFFQAEL